MVPLGPSHHHSLCSTGQETNREILPAAYFQKQENNHRLGLKASIIPISSTALEIIFSIKICRYYKMLSQLNAGQGEKLGYFQPLRH